MKSLFARILVPFDFSPQSEQALDAACELGPPGRSEITVLNAIPPVDSLAGIRPPGGPIFFPSNDLLAAERARLEKIAERVLRGRRVAKLRCRVVAGQPVAAILAAAAHADLIVMATTGRGAVSRLLIGSVAEKVVRQAPTPVLTIGRQAASRLGRHARTGSKAAPSRPPAPARKRTARA